MPRSQLLSEMYGDDFAEMDMMILFTSSGVTGESVSSDCPIWVRSEGGEVVSYG